MLPHIWRTVTCAVYGQSIRESSSEFSGEEQVAGTARKGPTLHIEEPPVKGETSDADVTVSKEAKTLLPQVTCPRDSSPVDETEIIDTNALSFVHERRGMFREEIALARRKWRESSPAQETSSEFAADQCQRRGTHQRPFKRLHCPYVGCNYYKIGTRTPILEHIRRKHADFLTTKKPGRCIFETPAGLQVDFDETSKDTLVDGQMLVVKKRNTSKSARQQQLYCPFKDCSTETSQRSYFYKHLRAAHSVDLPRISTSAKKVFSTVDGIIEFDAKSRNTLNPGQAICVELE